MPDGRTAAATIATGVAVLMIAQQIAAKAVRDALFLSEFPATALPAVMAVSAVVALVAVTAVSRWMTRRSPGHVVPRLFAVNAVLFAGEWALVLVQPRVAAVLVYVHTAAFGASLISAFWSVINERWDPRSAKRVVTRIAGGAAFGGVAGGAIAWALGTAVSLPAILPVLVLANGLCALGIRRIDQGASTGDRPAAPATTRGARDVFQKVPYLRDLAVLVALVALGDTLIDYVLKATVAAAYASAGGLVTFFAVFHTTAGLAAFALQAGVATRALQRTGLAAAIGTWPLMVLLGGPVALLVPALWSAIGLRGGAAVLENSLYRSGYELMYTPLLLDNKRSTKTFIDVGCHKLGAAAGGGLALVAVGLLPAAANSLVLGVAVLTAAISLMLLRRLHRGYVRALSDNLLSGAVALEEHEVQDATTRRTLADTAIALDRTHVLAEIERLRRQRGMDLLQRARQGEALRADHVQDLVPLLADDERSSETIDVLRSCADVGTDALISALGDGKLDVAIRRRIPQVLRAAPTQKVVAGLLHNLAAEEFAIRYRCAIALRRLHDKDAGLAIDRDAVFDAVGRECTMDAGVVSEERLAEDEFDEESTFQDPSLGRRLGRRLAYVFTMLSLVLDKGALEVAFDALVSDNQAMRGTALEYLDNVLPRTTRDAIWPLLGDRRVARAATRPRQQILDELMASSDRVRIDPRKLRKDQ